MSKQWLRLIRGSEVSSYQNCHKSWKLRWVDHLVRKYPDGKLFFGTLFHKYLEYYYTTGSGMQARVLMEQWLEKEDTAGMDPLEYSDLFHLYQDMASHYEEYYAPDFVTMAPIATELQFAIPLYDDNNTFDFAYTGTIDLVFLEDSKLKFMDHKTVASVDRYINNAVLDRQISRYWFALTALCQGEGFLWDSTLEKWVDVKDTSLYPILKHYKGPEEFIYNILRKDIPEQPKPLKKGGFSKAKDQNTTYELYMKALREAGLIKVVDGKEVEPSEYQDILVHLENQGNKFMRRLKVYRNWNECTEAMNDFAKVSREMMKVREEIKQGIDDHLYWNITYDTPSMNSYYPLIQAEIMGENTNMVLAGLFHTEKHEPKNDYIELEV